MRFKSEAGVAHRGESKGHDSLGNKMAITKEENSLTTNKKMRRK